uniref:t-SNARE coiled-coil homology domain-containing protein n=1 Tax=Steinernema glaseri TaxID=37863 RepID=A0A1I8AN23_9BILA
MMDMAQAVRNILIEDHSADLNDKITEQKKDLKDKTAQTAQLSPQNSRVLASQTSSMMDMDQAVTLEA